MVLETPIVFIIFNRADTTERVFAEIAKAMPSKLFVVADGPREERPGEAEKCAAARRIIDRVDWECEVFKNSSDANLGCGIRPATGISWALQQVEEAIILEDDCVPNQTFFQFCEELLERYRNDTRVMSISGFDLLFGQNDARYSYYFQRFQGVWGWATWRRAWKYFDMGMKLWPTLRETPLLLNILGNDRAAEYFRSRFDLTYGGVKDIWDYQWLFALWAQNGLCISPSKNLVSNIGFGVDATHTKSPKGVWTNLPSVDMDFPLRHPPYIAPDVTSEQFIIQTTLFKQPQPNWYRMLHGKFSSIIHNPLRKPISFLMSKFI